MNQSREQVVVKLPGPWFELYKILYELKSLPVSDEYLDIKKFSKLCVETLSSNSKTACLKFLH